MENGLVELESLVGRMEDARKAETIALAVENIVSATKS